MNDSLSITNNIADFLRDVLEKTIALLFFFTEMPVQKLAVKR
jgi:hypothetical protein